jgi:hypothetical protein
MEKGLVDENDDWHVVEAERLVPETELDWNPGEDVWWDSEPARLSPHALALCQDRQNVLLLSVVSVWEMQIKLHRSYAVGWRT